MLDDILEFLLELILDGMVEAAGDKQVPKPVRVVLTVILALFFIGLFGLLIWVGISNESVLMVVLCVALLIAAVIGIYCKVKKLRRKKP